LATHASDLASIPRVATEVATTSSPGRYRSAFLRILRYRLRRQCARKSTALRVGVLAALDHNGKEIAQKLGLRPSEVRAAMDLLRRANAPTRTTRRSVDPPARLLATN